MQTRSKYIGLLCGLLVWLAACHRVPSTAVEETSTFSAPADSVVRLSERPYALNSNFEVTADSLLLQQLPLMDVLPVYQGERLVVAEFMVQPTDTVDSVWVKVARDQETIGWVHQQELLQNVVPADSVSQFIYFFSNSRTVAFIVVLALFTVGYLYRTMRRKERHWAWFNDVRSVYPTLFLWLMATAATLYAGMQHVAPDTWQRFYYDPSLNPLDLPGVLALFMCNVWAIILVGLAVLDDLFHRLRAEAACFYLLGLMSCSILLYLFFTFTTYHYLGYPCLLAYTVWSFVRMRRTIRYRYQCGRCGALLETKGECPHCGAVNE